MLFNEPKLLKSYGRERCVRSQPTRFSALQRAEIAEIPRALLQAARVVRFSALQRAEIAEIQRHRLDGFLKRQPFQCSSTSRNC